MTSQPSAPENPATSEPRKEARRHPRESAAWPVMLHDGTRWLHTETINVSPVGAKLRLKGRLQPGDEVRLRFRPPGRKPFDVPALVWRIDPNGLALLFLDVYVREFPLAPKPAEASADLHPAANGDGRKTILLVDDDSEIRAVARAALEAQGYAVLDAGADLAQAIRIAKEHAGPIHLLLADIVLATLAGPDLVDQLLPLRPKIKTVFTSAYPFAASALGGAHLLAKPLNIEELATKVREMLDSQSPFARPRKP
ncbi:MAG TPA: response regulator [Methylomirabilota bacterium]|nr:response regulator [Methylomirabilota bacterium]